MRAYVCVCMHVCVIMEISKYATNYIVCFMQIIDQGDIDYLELLARRTQVCILLLLLLLPQYQYMYTVCVLCYVVICSEVTSEPCQKD